jgi:hypothetical protein
MSDIHEKPAIGEWISTYPAEIMVCDQDGTILEMSNVAIALYRKEGGVEMIGRNVFDHHQEPARSKMMSVVSQRQHVIYTTERGGNTKLVSIAPWYRQGEYAGFAMIVFDLPGNIPKIVKD